MIRLNLNDNKLNRLTNESFYKLVNLKYLFLKNNKIETLVDNIFSTNHNLYLLNLNDNLIIDIFYDFVHNKLLSRLHLTGNPLRGLKRSAFESLLYKRNDNIYLVIHIYTTNFTCDCTQLWLTNYTIYNTKFQGEAIFCTPKSLPSLINMNVACLIYKNCRDANKVKRLKKAQEYCSPQERGFI